MNRALNTAPESKFERRGPEEADAILASIGQRARAAQQQIALAPHAKRQAALRAGAALLRDRAAAVLEANQGDLEAGRERGLAAPMIDRLALNPNRLEGVAAGLDAIAERPDPLDRELEHRTMPNGLQLARRPKPIGVIGVIFEARPNVAADAAGLTIKSGNATVLRPGSEAMASAHAIAGAVRDGLTEAGLPADACLLLPDGDRALAAALMRASDYVDVLIPRGGKALVGRVQQEARMPVFAHLEGICHTYVHAAADHDMAIAIVENAKLRRTSVCGATETLLIDRAIAPALLAKIADRLIAGGCALLGCPETLTLLASNVGNVTALENNNWAHEYLDAVIAVRVVAGMDEALDHLRRYGSGHTDAIVTADPAAAARFLNEVDSAIVMHNASTQFADGGEFGLGAEIGIATGRIHARGPVGADELTIYNWRVVGDGHIRPT